MGIKATRWLLADAGVRRSKILQCESDETDERIEGEWGDHAVL